jgi:transcriptional regulator with XRE-family HTH domain
VPKRAPLLTDVELARFGAYLKACRDAKALTVHAVAIELAKKAKRRPARQATAVQRTNDNQIRAWEAGSKPASAETLKKLAELYDRSELEFLLKGGYTEEVVPFIVGLLKFARSQRHDLPFKWTVAHIGPGQKPHPGRREDTAIVAIWLGLRAFPPADELPLDENEIPRQDERAILHVVSRPTRLPRLISRALEALRDPLTWDLVRRRRRATEYFQDWLLHFEPVLYRYYCEKVYGDWI